MFIAEHKDASSGVRSPQGYFARQGDRQVNGSFSILLFWLLLSTGGVFLVLRSGSAGEQ
jgi:hypothetical protein